MIVHSTDFKESLFRFGREYKNKIGVYASLMLATQNDETILTEDGLEIIAKVSDSEVGIEIDDRNIYMIKKIIKGEILSTLMKEIDFESDLNLDLGNVINYQFGIKTDNGYEYLDYGNYIIYKKEYQNDTKTYVYTCYDFMLKSMIKIGDELSFIGNPTGDELLKKVCNILSINFDDSLYEEDGVTPTPYGMIKDKYYQINISVIKEAKITYRDLLDLLCQYFGVSMYVENNDLKIKLLGNIVEENNEWIVDNENVDIVDTIDEQPFKDKNIVFKSIYGKINALNMSGTDETKTEYVEDTQSIVANGMTLFEVKNNIILNDTNIWDAHSTDIANNIFGFINNVNFNLCDFSTYGILYLEWLDYYSVQVNNREYKCLLLNSEVTIKTGIVENIYTELPEKNVSEYTTSNKGDDVIADTIRARGNAYANGERLVQASELNAFIDIIYPVGSYYETSNTTFNPNNVWGGTWVEDTGGRVLIALDSSDSDFNSVNQTGGEKEHTLTINEMPSHKHSVNTIYPFNFGGNRTAVANSNVNYTTGTASDVVLNAGGGQAHNIVQPYIVVKRWHRTA